MEKKNYKWVLIIVKVILILILATSLAIALQEFGVRTENILLVFVAAVLLINIETKSLLVGMVSSFFCVAIFNFLFTEPHYTFIISDANYYISLLIFVIVTFIINALTSSLQRQYEISVKSETRSSTLNKISKSLLNAHSYEEIINIMQNAFSQMFQREVIIWMQIESKIIHSPETFDEETHHEKIDWCIARSTPCGYNQLFFADSKYQYFPFQSSKDRSMKGVSIIKADGSPLSLKDISLLEASISSMLIACDREFSMTENEVVRINIEKEKFKSSILRSISHDIKTPLTSITAGSSLLLEGFNSLDENERTKLLKDINNESMYLADFVTNLLNMTKIDANRLTLEKHHEIVEDILAEVMKHIRSRLDSHTINITKKKEVTLVDVDHQLFVQVLINLIDNSIKHTLPNSIITIDYYCQDNALYFEIKDNGGGIDEDKLKHLFEDFVSVKLGKADKSRGTGLGLYICSAIIGAHGGKISAFNNEMGGATFKFFIPYLESEGI